MQSLTRLTSAVRRRIECLRALATARRDSIARLHDTAASRVLVVCYGNIYRSPFVEACFAVRPVEGVAVRSVGLHPVAGRESPPRHVAMSRKHGVELGAHQSRVLARADLDWAQLVVLMDRHNWQALVERGADRQRLVWLGALDGGAVEIPDPYELNGAQAERIVVRLVECAGALAVRLKSAQSRSTGG